MKKLLSFILLCLLLTACGTGREYIRVPVEVEKVRTDTVTKTLTKRDSIYIYDKEYVAIIGDTVYKELWHTKYKYIERTDTFIETKVDSIPYEVQVDKIIKQTPKWREVTSNLFIGAMAIFLVWFFIRKKF